jgi:ethanolaminephosphotransferase
MILTSAFLSWVYVPHLDSPAPRWVYFAHGILLFLYQTFDAVDGKQARRTNSSSPLGELFDHGCDALTVSFETLAFASTLMSGKYLTFWFWLIAASTFYLATWESFFTDTLILPVLNGPTEGLMLFYIGHIFTGIVGPEFWTQNIKDIPVVGSLPFVPDVPLVLVMVLIFGFVAALPTLIFNFVNVHKVVRGRGTSFRSALAMLFPFWTLVGGIVFWGYISPADVIGNQPHLFYSGSGFAFAYMVGRLILAHLCEEPKGLKTGMCTALLYLPFAISNALSANFFDGKPLVDETWVLVGYCAFTLCLYGHFVVSVIQEITQALGIHCFKIGKVKDGKGT